MRWGSLPVDPSFKLPIYLLNFSFYSISVIFLYLFLLLLSQTSGQSPDSLVCPWMKRSICIICIWTLHLCSVTELHCVWNWWIRCSLVGINETAASSVELCWFTPPWRPGDAIPDRSFRVPFDRLPLVVVGWHEAVGSLTCACLFQMCPQLQ